MYMMWAPILLSPSVWWREKKVCTVLKINKLNIPLLLPRPLLLLLLLLISIKCECKFELVMSFQIVIISILDLSICVMLQEKMYVFCDKTCTDEFRRTHYIVAQCVYCKIEKVVKEVKRINNMDCSFCSEGRLTGVCRM